MKEIKVILLLTLPILLINCGDDDGDTNYVSQFVGTWQSSIITTSGCSNEEENGTLTCDPYCYEITISDNGTYTLEDLLDQRTESGELTATATTVTLCSTGSSNCDEDNIYSFSNDNTFSIVFTDFPSEGCQIISHL